MRMEMHDGNSERASTRTSARPHAREYARRVASPACAGQGGMDTRAWLPIRARIYKPGAGQGDARCVGLEHTRTRGRRRLVMSEQEDATQAWRERAASFTEAELVTWSFVFEHMARIEDHLQELTGHRPPDAEVAAILRILQWQLKKRICAYATRYLYAHAN